MFPWQLYTVLLAARPFPTNILWNYTVAGSVSREQRSPHPYTEWTCGSCLKGIGFNTCLLRGGDVVRSKLKQNGTVEDHKYLQLSLLTRLLGGRQVLMALGQNLSHTYLLHGVGGHMGGGWGSFWSWPLWEQPAPAWPPEPCHGQTLSLAIPTSWQGVATARSPHTPVYGPVQKEKLGNCWNILMLWHSKDFLSSIWNGIPFWNTCYLRRKNIWKHF